MKQFSISYEQFEGYMNGVVKRRKLRHAISDLTLEYRKTSNDLTEIELPSDADYDVLSLLAILTDDEDDWIDCWVDELDCGEKYVEGMIVDANDNSIPCKTIKDLWELLLHVDES